MNEHYFEIFNHDKATRKWHKRIEFAEKMDELPIKVREEYIQSLKFLNDELGKGFLKVSGYSHFLGKRVMNWAPPEVERLNTFVKTLRDIKADKESNYPKLLKKLIPRDTYRIEGASFVDIAHSYIKQGFRVHFPHEIQGKKTHDIEVYSPRKKETIFIEVTYLEESGNRKEILNNFNRLYHKLHHIPPNLPHSCLQKVIIPEEEFPHVLNKIQELENEAYEKTTIVSYEDEYIDIAIAHPEAKEKLMKWCKNKGNRRADVIGLSFDPDETKRILANNKIKFEVEQLDPKAPGLIYIQVNALHFLVHDAERTISLLAPEINKYPNLIGVVLHAEIGEFREEAHGIYEGHFFGRKEMCHGTMRNLFFIYNDKRTVPVSDTLLNHMYQSFL